jgi:lysophospholipase L1-like esterase
VPPQDLECKLIVVSYCGHLLVPFCVFIDLAAASHIASLSTSEWVLALFCGLWLFGGTSALLSPFLRRKITKMWRPLAVFYGLLLAAGMFEICARPLIGKQFLAPASVWPPHSRIEIRHTPGVAPDLSAKTMFTTNELGLRGPAIPQSSAYKILTLGGSTTECMDLDDSEEWPHLLMAKLNSGQSVVQAWVANGGVSGYTTAEHLAFLKRISALASANVYIFLIGINDLQATLAVRGGSSSQMLDSAVAQMDRRWLAGARGQRPYFRRLLLFQIARRVGTLWQARNTHDAVESRTRTTEQFYLAQRQQRKRAPRVPLPDLSIGLAEYRQRIDALDVQCRLLQKRCIFLTQPALWANPTEADEALMWFGWVGPVDHPDGYLTSQDAFRALTEYNSSLLQDCAQRHMECYDDSAILSSDTRNFYDDVHFTRTGAEHLASYLSSQLLASRPFVDQDLPPK